MPDIGGKSVRVHASNNSAVSTRSVYSTRSRGHRGPLGIKDVIWGHRRYVNMTYRRYDTRKIFGMLNIWSCRRFPLCEWVLTEKYISDDLQPMIQARYRAAEISAYFRAKVCWITPSLLITVRSGRTYRPYFSVILRYFLHFCDSYCKVMQCETSCRQSIVQCENSSVWMLPQVVMQCKNSSDPMTLKIVQCELVITWMA